jgi:hypothetical protein
MHWAIIHNHTLRRTDTRITATHHAINHLQNVYTTLSTLNINLDPM